MISPSLKIPENFIRERNKATEAEGDSRRNKVEEDKIWERESKRQEGEKTDRKVKKEGRGEKRDPRLGRKQPS